MNFISVEYYIALLLVLLILVSAKKSNKKYLIILLINYVFAYLFGIYTLITIVFITIYSYLLSKSINNNRKYLSIGIIPLILVLIVFKLFNLYSNTIIPIGLSFYSLQAIGYLCDISKDNTKYESNFLLYASSLSFFPAISSGPIEKLTSLMTRLKNDLGYNNVKAQKGIQLIAEGLFKRLVIANRIVDYVDTIYANPDAYNGFTILIAVVLYAIQIYCDFSAYSDIAIGSANLIGIDLCNNFDNPYFSKSIKEFWRRWHISLSSWLKEYVYIPIGGNRVSKIKRTFNIIVTFLVSGLWHGLNANYLIWGLIHGLLNAFPTKQTSNRIRNCFKTLLTFACVSLSWIFFRASSVSNALSVFNGLFTRFSLNISSISSAIIVFTGDIMSIPYAITTFLMILILFIKEWTCIYKPNSYKENVYLGIIVICTILFSTNGNSAFIYQGF